MSCGDVLKCDWLPQRVVATKQSYFNFNGKYDNCVTDDDYAPIQCTSMAMSGEYI